MGILQERAQWTATESKWCRFEPLTVPFFLVAKKKWTNSKTRQVRILVFDATVLGFSTEWVCLDQIPPAKTCDRGNGGYHAVGGKGLDLVICCLVGPDEIRVRIHEFVVACLFKRNMVQTAPI